MKHLFINHTRHHLNIYGLFHDVGHNYFLCSYVPISLKHHQMHFMVITAIKQTQYLIYITAVCRQNTK